MILNHGATRVSIHPDAFADIVTLVGSATNGVLSDVAARSIAVRLIPAVVLLQDEGLLEQIIEDQVTL